ncbi:phosphomannomutase/phosphoglucomutase [Myxococcota bacterium]|nr:phosphomannomutase/phosphoglucomutase [Myxococcota bacterium]
MTTPPTPSVFNPRVFREYDIRGKAETDLHDDFARALGRAYGTYIRRRGGRRVAVGRDCRVSGPRIFAAFSGGIRESGLDVIDLGVVPTPVLYFALYRDALAVDGGVCITGSHNPGDENGFKMCVGRGSLYGAEIQKLRAMIDAGDFDVGAGEIEAVDLLPAYYADLEARLRPGRRLKVVIDAGNGMGGLTGGRVYRALGHEVIELFCDLDGSFPNHHPDPTVEANLTHLRRAVAEHGADLGIAFDGDADRIGAIDARGRVVWGDQLLTFFGRSLLDEHPAKDIRVVCEVKCSEVVAQDLGARGISVEMWKVGHSLIKTRMKETGALLAGEMSGHLFFADRYYGYDDAVYAGARLLEIVSRGQHTLAELLDSLPPSVTTPELRLPCADDLKFGVVAQAAEHFRGRYPVNEIDGVRITFPHGWGLLRPSNTGPVLVMRFEADSPARLAAYRDEVEACLRGLGVDVNAPGGH